MEQDMEMEQGMEMELDTLAGHEVVEVLEVHPHGHMRTASAEDAHKATSYEDLLGMLGALDVKNHNIRDLDEKIVRMDANAVRYRLKRRGMFLLNPHSTFNQWWDVATILALIFTMTVTPFEVCMVDTPPDEPINGLFIANQVVNCIFVIDMVFIFFLPYKEQGKEATWIKSHRRIASRYLRSWFVLDVISVFPFDIFTRIGVFGDMNSATLSPSLLKMPRMIRLLRLLKLVRVVRASRIFSRWEHSFGFKYATKSLFFWVGIITLTLHWCACAWGLVAQLMGSQRSNELVKAVTARMVADASCSGCTLPNINDCEEDCLTECEIDIVANMTGADAIFVFQQENWLCRYRPSGLVNSNSAFDVWIVCIIVVRGWESNPSRDQPAATHPLICRPSHPPTH